MALSDHQGAVEALIRDNASEIEETDRDRAIAAAVAEYSRDRPRRRVADLVMAAGALPLPDDWDAATSALAAIEHPLGEVPPAWRPVADWTLYQEPARTVIRPVGASAESCPPGDGETVRVSYTAPHAVDAMTDTVPAADREAVAAWAAALLLDELAADAAATVDSTIEADSVEHASRARDYRALARAHRDRYYLLVGRGNTGRQVRAAGTAVQPRGPRRRWYDLGPRWGFDR